MLSKLAAVLGIRMISSFATADDDIKESLPGMEKAPPTFDACVERGAYDMLCLTAQERAVATTCHCVQLLHLPGKHGLERYALMQMRVSFACKCAEHMMNIWALFHACQTFSAAPVAEQQNLHLHIAAVVHASDELLNQHEF